MAGRLVRSIRMMLAAGTLTLATSTNAWAVPLTDQHPTDFLPVGLLFGKSWSDGMSFGQLGVEATWVRHPVQRISVGAAGKSRDIHVRSPFGYGAFAQAQLIGLTNHARFALGPQVNLSWIGVESGLFLETANSDHASSFGLHLAPFFSTGFVSVAFRLGVPFVSLSSDGTRYPIDYAVIGTAKIPITLD